MNLSPLLVQRFVDNNGNSLVGGLLYTYAAGTTTPIATYTDSTGGTPNSNPVVANARGEMNVWIDPTLAYKFVLTDQYGSLVWSVDSVLTPFLLKTGGTLTGLSGVTLTINAQAGSVACIINAASGQNGINVQGGTGGNATIGLSANAAAQTGFVGHVSGGALSLIATDASSSVVLGTNNAAKLTVTSAGNATLAAPSSGITLTVNGVSGTHSAKIADSATNSYNAGYLESPINGQATPYTAVLSDSGKTLYYSGTGAAAFTIPSNASVPYPTGTILTFINDATGATNMTIAITSDVMVLSPGLTTGSRTLAQGGRAVAQKVSAARWMISGTGLT